MKIIDVALKDLIRSSRSMAMLVFMFGVPLMVSGIFYLMFGSMADEGGFDLPRTRVIVANLDKHAPRLQGSTRNLPGDVRANTMSELVVKILQSDDMADLITVSLAPNAESARRAVDEQLEQVAIIIPDGFSRKFADPYDEAVVEFYQDPTLTLGPGVVKSILSRFMDGLSGVKIVVSVALDAFGDNDAARIGLVVQRFMDESKTQDVDLETVLLDERSPAPAQKKASTLVSIIGPILGGMMVFFAFFTATSSAESILQEEEEGTLQRLFTTPTPAATILAGKFLAVFLTVLIQLTGVLSAGYLIFHINWGDLRSVVVTTFGAVCIASSFGIFLNSWLKDTRQGGMIFGGVVALTGMIGMVRVFGLNSTGASGLMVYISLLVPQGWVVRGLLMMLGGQSGAPILLNTLGMLVWSAIFFTVGVWRFTKRYSAADAHFMS